MTNHGAMPGSVRGSVGTAYGAVVFLPHSYCFLVIVLVKLAAASTLHEGDAKVSLALHQADGGMAECGLQP